MAVIVFCLLLFLLWFCIRVVPRSVQNARTMAWRHEEIERTRKVIERDPSNSGTRAKLAAFLIEDGDLDAGIHEYRTAIGTSPQGPFTTEWKRKLRDALELQAILARGEKPLGFHEWRACGQCNATVPIREKTCPKCGLTLNKGLVEWGMDPNTQREIWREAIPISIVLLVVIAIFSALPTEVKGILIISSLLVGGWLFLRSFDK
ncbi:hypothetical protein EON80_04085 [bacterium]|nr:MAG: hypothetical protein EON80_04085 [bacterium]